MADPSASYLGKTLIEEISPVVMVLRTPLVEDSSRKNGLSFVDTLRPFSLFHDIDVPVRTASDQPYRLHKFKLRLHYASEIRQPNVEASEEHLKNVVTRASDVDTSDLRSDPPQIDSLLDAAESESLPSWFQIFNKELIHIASFSEHEAFDHPVACLLVVSSKDEQPLNKFVELFDTNQLPSLLNDGIMDPKILKHYLLLHDNQDGTLEKASNILAEMRSTFGSNECRLLTINSAEDGSTDWQDNPWIPHKIDASISQDLGCLLNMDDINEMKNFMQDLASKHIIPHMEQKIRVLNQQVSATRKGFRNQIKNLWWRKGKEDAPEISSGQMYAFNSIESQMRVLGDYAFMLRDYELALSNYRLLSTDYKLDKAWKRYAGVQEMMGLAFFMLDQSKKDVEYCMENALSTYLKLGSSGQRNVTRCGLWWTEILKARDQYKEAAGVYFRISNEEPSLQAAVMLEQASYCYLFSKPPMLRKYGFHLVLAGNRYYISEQRKHAIRAYRSATSVYKGNAWSFINDHVHYHIGKWYSFIEIFDVALQHLLEVVACSHQSVATQELFLKDFLQTVQKLGKAFEVFSMQLPVINIPSLKVLFEDQRTYGSVGAVNIKESLWKCLEEDMIPLLPAARTNWLESQPKLSKKLKDSNICVAGEPIRVEIEFRNPLKIPISVSGASLICQLSAEPESVESAVVNEADNNVDGNSSATVFQNDSELIKLKRSWEQDAGSSFVLSEVDFSLGGSETTVIQFVVTPKVEGILNIVGVRWKLSDSVIGYHSFDTTVLKKKTVKGRRRGGQYAKSPLKFTVIKSLPKLECCIHHLPSKAYAGELQRLVLELKNRSKFPVKNMKMKISDPRFLNTGSLDDMKIEFPICLEKRINSKESIVQPNDVEGSNGLLFSFPEDCVIEGETTFTWPLWLHTSTTGRISLYMSIYYEMENSSNDIRYRTLRTQYDLEVLPSLDMSVHVAPCPSRLQEFLVRMDVTNRSSSESFLLHQFSSVGHDWEISSLPPDGVIHPSQMLTAGQALSCFFKLKKCNDLASEGMPSSTTLHGSDVRLGPHDSEKALFDISRAPLANFHSYERLDQGKSIQGSSNVDFILISQLKQNASAASDPPRLFSHHSCHHRQESKSLIHLLVVGYNGVQETFSHSLQEWTQQLVLKESSGPWTSLSCVYIQLLPPPPGPVRLVSQLVQLKGSSTTSSGWSWWSLPNTKIAPALFAVPAARGSQLNNRFMRCQTQIPSRSPSFISAASCRRVIIAPQTKKRVLLFITAFIQAYLNLGRYYVGHHVSPIFLFWRKPKSPLWPLTILSSSTILISPVCVIRLLHLN
ncbi:hypothetical protein Scep_003466 [Stephania cephalantha]|uniref:Trafficking protein particle complex subunit 8 n=1 Tax=Stephania cephalantha TaxID=152367 RepID=A0AAP0PUE8_9MAGN